MTLHAAPHAHDSIRLLPIQGSGARLVGTSPQHIRVHPQRLRRLRRRRPRRALQWRTMISVPRLDGVHSPNPRTVLRPRYQTSTREKDGRTPHDGSHLSLLSTDGAQGQARQLTERPNRAEHTSRSGEEGNSPRLLSHHRQHRIWHPAHLYRVEDLHHYDVRRTHEGRRLRSDPLRTLSRRPKTPTEAKYRPQQQTSSRWRDRFIASKAERPATR